MKSIVYVFVLLCYFNVARSQTIYIANSNPGAAGGTNVYTGASSLQMATSVAANGDIIYVVPSPVEYSSPSFPGRSLTLIGGGFNPANGGALSTVREIFGVGNNSRLSGLVITRFVSLGDLVSNIMIDKCRIPVIQGSNISNIVIENCLLGESGSLPIISLAIASANVTISNNVIYATGPAVFSSLQGAMINNNMVVGGGGYATFEHVTNCTIQNNIFYGMSVDTGTNFSNNVQRNNLKTPGGPLFSTANGNTSINNLEDVYPLFANFVQTPAFNFSYDLTLQSGSPGIGTGFGGVDMGVFGGASPYDIYGTSLPAIQNIIAPHSTAQGVNMSVRIQAKGN